MRIICYKQRSLPTNVVFTNRCLDSVVILLMLGKSRFVRLVSRDARLPADQNALVSYSQTSAAS